MAAGPAAAGGEVGSAGGGHLTPPAGGGPRSGLANFYAGLLTEAELADLAGAADRGLADEVALLRALARRAVAAGDQRGALAILRGLVAALKVQHGLGGQAEKQLDQALAAVLDELGRELDRPL